MVFWATKNEGTRFRTVSSMSALGCAPSSVAPMTSIGEAESVTERSVRRVPMTTIESLLSAAVVSAVVVCASAGSDIKIARLATVAASATFWPRRIAFIRMEISVLGYPPSSLCGHTAVPHSLCAAPRKSTIAGGNLIECYSSVALAHYVVRSAANQSSDDFIANIGVCGSCAAIRASSRSRSLSAMMIPWCAGRTNPVAIIWLLKAIR